MLYYLANSWECCPQDEAVPLQCPAILFVVFLPPRFSLCQVRSCGLVEAFFAVIGRSIHHSAHGTLAALIRSLGLLTSQSWMLQQNTDQMTVSCFVGTCKDGGRRQRKGTCLASAAPEAFFLHLFGAFVSLLLPQKCNNVHRSSFVLQNARGEYDSLWVNLISAG